MVIILPVNVPIDVEGGSQNVTVMPFSSLAEDVGQAQTVP